MVPSTRSRTYQAPRGRWLARNPYRNTVARVLKEQIYAVKSCSDERHERLYRAAQKLGSLLHTGNFAEADVVAAYLMPYTGTATTRSRLKHRSTVKAGIKQGKANPASTAHLGAHRLSHRGESNAPRSDSSKRPRAA